ncbi:MAG TPA: ribosome rescue GTPase HflX [Gammaproteobacteria bacterium]|nr:ribosome rescue GTPase HflX [Gammaproteobacteria bacterium]
MAAADSQNSERAVLVHLDIDLEPARGSDRAAEFAELARSAGADPVAAITGHRHAPDPHSFAGVGKVEEIRAAVVAHKADIVLFNHALSPSQERNLERALKCRVLGRTGLILDIFARRARSFEGKLQVELAQLKHLSTRLVRGWTHLERQKGGIGLRGPGETQLETDRRLIGGRIKQINRKLEKVQKQRAQGRRNRRRRDVPSISLVGYTNAGKSTLFNRLTGAGVYSADQLFATLDPTIRRLPLDGAGEAVVADTVGFIRDLPHDLVAAFHSTLQETEEADLLLHVIDAADDDRVEHIRTVNAVLAEIGAADVAQIEIFNKIDVAGREPGCEYGDDGLARRVWVSAETGAGLDLLSREIARIVARDTVGGWLTLSANQGRLRSRLFGLGAVREEHLTGAGDWVLKVCLPRRDYQQLQLHEGMGGLSD